MHEALRHKIPVGPSEPRIPPRIPSTSPSHLFFQNNKHTLIEPFCQYLLSDTSDRGRALPCSINLPLSARLLFSLNYFLWVLLDPFNRMVLHNPFPYFDPPQNRITQRPLQFFRDPRFPCLLDKVQENFVSNLVLLRDSKEILLSLLLVEVDVANFRVRGGSNFSFFNVWKSNVGSWWDLFWFKH